MKKNNVITQTLYSTAPVANAQRRTPRWLAALGSAVKLLFKGTLFDTNDSAHFDADSPTQLLLPLFTL